MPMRAFSTRALPMRTFLAATCAALLAASCAALLAAGPAQAQRSLFDTPPASGTPTQAAPAPAAAAPDAPAAPKPKKRAAKPRGPVPARALAISNASSTTLSGLEVSADGKTAKLAKPIKAKGRASLKLPAFKSCNVSVMSTLEGSAAVDHEVDICKEKSVRITDG